MQPEEETTPYVCVIDDDTSLRKALDRLLRAAGYSVQMLESAEAYLERERGSAARAGCLLLDVRMPNMTGLELQRRIADRDPPPIIFISAHDDPRARREAHNLGAVDFLLKPLDSTRLLDAVDRALDPARPRE